VQIDGPILGRSENLPEVSPEDAKEYDIERYA
jgi:hypothetical protein